MVTLKLLAGVDAHVRLRVCTRIFFFHYSGSSIWCTRVRSSAHCPSDAVSNFLFCYTPQRVFAYTSLCCVPFWEIKELCQTKL